MTPAKFAYIKNIKPAIKMKNKAAITTQPMPEALKDLKKSKIKISIKFGKIYQKRS